MGDTFGVLDPTADADGQRALDETPSPHEIASSLNEPATVGYVQRYVLTHQRWCPALRVLRRWSMAVAVGVGFVLALQAVGIFSAKAVIAQIVEKAMDEALTKRGYLQPHGEISADAQNAVAQVAP
jgi:hypothetical protein